MQQQHATTTTTTTDQIRPAQHNAAIRATCVRAHHSLHQPSPHASVALIAASGCAGPIWSVVVVVVVVVCCCCIPYRLALMVGPDLCTLRLWRFPSFNWNKHSTCTTCDGGAIYIDSEIWNRTRPLALLCSLTLAARQLQ